MYNDTTEYDKMLRGEVYNALDAYLLQELNICKDHCWEYNQIRPTLIRERNLKLQAMLGRADERTFINQPFFCDYGRHIRVGKRFFANFNWTVLDEAYVTIGDDCFIGPNVSIYTACHSTDPNERNTRQEWARPVTIGDNCWLGGSVTILPGVTIGNNVTIGAGSVVVGDIPSDSVAVGNPARVIKRLPPSPYTIRRATADDIPAMLAVFDEGKRKMRESGNMHQWTGDYPSADLLMGDIQRGFSYVVTLCDRIVGTFVLAECVEPTYATIVDGRWLDDTHPYATIHRMASLDGYHGIMDRVTAWASARIDNLRIDTHRDNAPMRHIVEKLGFTYCGIIYLANGDERLAYQRIQ